MLNNLLGEAEDLVAIRSHDLDVDRGWQSEIEDLSDDVGRRKPNRNVRELFAHLQSNLADEIVCRDHALP